MSELRTDILPEDLTTPKPSIIVTQQYNYILQNSDPIARSRSVGNAKDLIEFYDLVRRVILDFERRMEQTAQAKIFFTEEDPDFGKKDNITIVFSLVKRMPGVFGKGPPFAGDTHSLKPILREEVEDIENPGYKRAVLGYTHDNEVKFTIFARTNKIANRLAEDFEKIIQEYQWFFVQQGVLQLIYLKRGADFAIEETGVKLYGRPVHYYVRTETLNSISQKKIEQIQIGYTVSPE